MASSLAGIRVLDFSRFFAGPVCGMLLSDMGAEVIRIDSPRGEIDRTYALCGPDGETITFKAINRGKKGITLRPNTPEGTAVLSDLVQHSDVVIHNFVPGTKLAGRLDYAGLKKSNPGIIVAAVTGFGQYGPYAERVCLDYVTQAKSGIMSMTGFPDDPPTRTSVAFVDFGSGVSAALGILLALFHREKTGLGQAVDVALYDTASFLTQTIGAIMASSVLGQDVAEKIYRRGGNFGWSSYMNCLEAKDGWVMITPTSEGLWQRFVKTIDNAELVADLRCQHDRARGENASFIDNTVKAWVAKRTVQEVVTTLQDAGVPCEPVNTMYGLVDDPQIKAREMIVFQEHPDLGTIPLPGTPLKLSLTPGRIAAPAPRLGEHNEEIYGKLLGYDREKLAHLKQSGVI